MAVYSSASGYIEAHTGGRCGSEIMTGCVLKVLHGHLHVVKADFEHNQSAGAVPYYYYNQRSVPLL
eukprot:scaffold108827_cov46-Prasinocladus_malaysianus.AAC.7